MHQLRWWTVLLWVSSNIKTNLGPLRLWHRADVKKKKETPEGVFARCVGVSKNYVEWLWKVEQCINNKSMQERRRCSVKYTRRWVTHNGSFAPQTKTYINITTIYVKSMGWFTNNCIPALLISSINALPHSTIACNVSDCRAQGCALKKIFREPLGLPSISGGVTTPKRCSPK